MSKGVLIDLNIMRDEGNIKNKTIIVWGAGDKGKNVIKLFKKADIRILYVCDSNAKLWGTKIDGYVVRSPFELCSVVDAEKICVIMCTIAESNQEIRKTLDYIVDVKYEYATYFGIINMFRFHYRTLFKNESVKSLFQAEKEIGWLKFQQRKLQILSDICGVNDGDVLVFQPGKVGSISILVNLKKEKEEVFHFHHIHFPANILQEKHIKMWETALESVKCKKIKMIVGVREPISRDISAFFEVFSERNLYRRGDWIFENGNLYDVFERYMDTILHDSYGQWINGVPDVWGDEFLWFDREIKRLWGIDIYQYPFDREKGYSIIRSAGIEIFLYKSEKLNDISKELYMFVLNRPISQFSTEYKTDISWRNEAYQEFKNNVILNSEYVDHYYKNNKKMDYLKKWEKNIAPKKVI